LGRRCWWALWVARADHPGWGDGDALVSILGTAFDAGDVNLTDRGVSIGHAAKTIESHLSGGGCSVVLNGLDAHARGRIAHGMACDDHGRCGGGCGLSAMAGGVIDADDP